MWIAAMLLSDMPAPSARLAPWGLWMILMGAAVVILVIYFAKRAGESGAGQHACPSCGAAAPSKAQYCPRCGKPLG